MVFPELEGDAALAAVGSTFDLIEKLGPRWVNPNLPVEQTLDDGSYLSTLRPARVSVAQTLARAITVRVIDYTPRSLSARCWWRRWTSSPLATFWCSTEATRRPGWWRWVASQRVV